MKSLTIIFLLFFNNLFSQQKVDITITDVTDNNIEITLTPRYPQFSILSNVQFTLIYPTSITLGEPNQIVSTSQRVGKYHVFAGFGMEPTQIETISINIPKTGEGKIEIADDIDINLNGEFYTSIGGEDVTGKIIVIDMTENTSELYWDQKTKQLLIKKNNKFINMLGQPLLPDRHNLQFIGYK